MAEFMQPMKDLLDTTLRKTRIQPEIQRSQNVPLSFVLPQPRFWVEENRVLMQFPGQEVLTVANETAERWKSGQSLVIEVPFAIAPNVTVTTGYIIPPPQHLPETSPATAAEACQGAPAKPHNKKLKVKQEKAELRRQKKDLRKGTSRCSTPDQISPIYENQCSSSSNDISPTGENQGSLSSNNIAQDAKDAEFSANLALTNGLNMCLVFLNAAEKKVDECLKKSARSPSIRSLQQLEDLRRSLRKFLDKLEEFFHKEEVQIKTIRESTQFQDILKSAKTLQGIFEELDNSGIPQLLETTAMNPQQDIICSILGLSNEVVAYLKNIDPEYKDHQSEKSWIEDYIGSKKKELVDGQTTEEQLRSLGFIPAKAKALARQIHLSEYSGHQTILQWAEDHISSQFKYNILLGGKPNIGHTKPFNKTGNYDEEYYIPTHEEEDAVHVKAQDSFMLTKGELDDVPWLTDFTVKQDDTLEGPRFWFHGTDPDSAVNIIRDGIKFVKARATDFADEGGFYLSNSYEMAHEWAKTRNPKASAVLVFEF